MNRNDSSQSLFEKVTQKLKPLKEFYESLTFFGKLISSVAPLLGFSSLLAFGPRSKWILISSAVTLVLVGLSWHIWKQRNPSEKRRSLADANHKFPRLRKYVFLLPSLGLVLMGWSFVYYYFPPNSNKILIIVAKFDEDQKVNLRRTILSEINNIKDRFPEVEMMSCGTEECNKEYKVEEKGAEKAVEFGKQQLREEGLQKGLIIWGYYKNEKKGKIFINRFNLSPEDIELKSEIKFEGILAKSDVQLEIEDKISESMAYFIVLLAGIAQYESGNYVEAIDRFNDAEKRNAVPDELVDSKYLYYFRGNAFTYVHRYLEAVSDFTKAIKNPITNVESNFAEAYNNRALALTSLFRFDEAFLDFEQASKMGLDSKLISINKSLALNFTKQSDKAISELNEAINKLQPVKNKRLLAIAYNNLAQSHTFKGWSDETPEHVERDKHLGQAETYNQKSLNIDPEYLQAVFFRGDFLMNLKKYDEAVSYYSQFVTKAPKDYRFHNQIGLVFLLKGDFDAAIEAFEKAMSLYPNDALVLNNIANAYHRKARKELKVHLMDRAIEYHKKAIQSDPNLVGLHFNLGNTYWAKRMYQEAISEFSEEIRRYPNSPDIAKSYLYRGEVYEDIENIELADKDYAQAKQLDDNIPQNPFDNFALVYEAKDYNEALKYINIALKLSPNEPKYLAWKGKTLQRLSKRVLAVECYLKALALNDNDAETHYNLGVAYAEENKFTEAIKSYSRAIQLEKGMQAATYTNRGIMYFNLKRYSEALEDFNTAINTNPNEALAYYNRGQLHYSNRSFALAKADLERVINLPCDANLKQAAASYLSYLR